MTDHICSYANNFGNTNGRGFGNEWKIGRKFVVGLKFLQSSCEKKMGSLDLDHQGEDLWEHRAFIGHSQMAKLCFLWFLNTK